MKKLILIISILTSLPLFADITFVVDDLCHTNKNIISASLIFNEEHSIGDYTIDTLSKNNIDFLGNENGMNSIANSPYGNDAIKIINDNELYAYGWCYHVNDKEPALMPNELKPSDKDVVKWFYAYSHLLDGEWIEMCIPSNINNSEWLCNN